MKDKQTDNETDMTNAVDAKMSSESSTSKAHEANQANLANYTISESDLVQAGLLHQRKSDSVKLILLVVFIALIVIGLSSSYDSLGSITLFAVIFFAVFTWVLPMCNKQVFKKQYQQTKALQQANILTLQEAGLHWQHTHGQALLPWGHIFKWKENEQFLLVYQNDFLFHVIPKHIGEQAFDLPMLQQALQQHVGPAVS